MGRAGRRKQKSSEFLKKIYAVGYLTSSVKQMLFQPPVCHQNKGERACFYCVIFMCIYLYYLYLLCMFVFYLSVFIYEYMAYSHFLEKRVFCLLTLLKRMPFLTISNKNIFSKLRAID